MKKSLFIAAFIIGLSCSVNAQQKGPKDRLANLNLTEQQKTSVDSLRKVFDKKRADVKKDEAVTEDDKKTKLKDIHKEFNKELNAILTPEQRKQLKEETKAAQSNQGQ